MKTKLGNMALLALLWCVVTLLMACGVEPLSPETSRSSVPLPKGDQSLVKARVVSVIDGATIEVEIDEERRRVRYLGIEIPTRGVDGNSEINIYQEAFEFNRFMVERQTVELEKGDVDTGPTGHLLRYVYVNGEMVSEALLANGLATVSGFPSLFRYQSLFLSSEESARTGLRGVWVSSGFSDQPRVQTSSSPESAPDPIPTAVPRFSGTLPPVPKSP